MLFEDYYKKQSNWFETVVYAMVKHPAITKGELLRVVAEHGVADPEYYVDRYTPGLRALAFNNTAYLKRGS